ncbi:MAG: TetR/AcrR family transcriptional regulator [Planctomycetota bacterium]|jgi:AcrR family transcriptional regulator
MAPPPPPSPRDSAGEPASPGSREQAARPGRANGAASGRPSSGGSPRAERAPTSDEGSGTRERLLDAAEALFAEHGYPSTSLRQITGAAGANLAAVHYHFGSKLSLFQEVLHRRLGPINEARIERLKRAIADSPDGAPDLDAVLRAMLAPALELAHEGGDGELIGRLIGRSISADGDHWRSLKREFDEVFEHFMPVFKRLCPHLPPTHLMWRMHFVGGCLGSLLQGSRKLVAFSDGHCDPRDLDVVLDQLVAFARAGLEAPAVATSTEVRPPCPPSPES